MSRFLIVLFAGGFVLQACRGSQVPPGSNTETADTRKTTSTTPPFSTKEPHRYQAIRITNITETANPENSPSSQSNQVLIARDGDKRREEYSGASGQIVYLEIPAGRFILLPASRVYADLSKIPDESNRSEDSPALSPDQLLNEAQLLSTYQNLGTETIAGRMTTKYRVVQNTGNDSRNETLMWIDESLGMPVRSESTSQSNGRSSKVTTELKDVRLEVDEHLFSWPSDYRKVEARLVFDLMRKSTKPVAGKAEAK